eukprot:gb/GECH01007599.1/.p1 GENE.gb/GECH01007599.1/~~gb/GECH01007599.1/.p1  ORF type:complete len:221 (+),score=47.80 gb/GECH01007599.1/:1-663(+)
MKTAQEMYTVFETQCRHDHDNINVWLTNWTMSWRQKSLHRYILTHFKNNSISEIIQECVWGKNENEFNIGGIKDDHEHSNWMKQFRRWSYDWLAHNIVAISPDEDLDEGKMEFVIFGAHDSFIRFTATHSNGTTIISSEADWTCPQPPSHVLYRHKNALNVDYLFSETNVPFHKDSDVNSDSAEITMSLLGILIECDSSNRDMDTASFIDMLRAVVSEII